MCVRLLFIVLVCSMESLSAWAQNATSVGSLDLKSTIESISIRASFSNDDDQDNTAMVEYRQSGLSTWLPAYTPMLDRRVSITGNSNAEYVDEARVSIVGLHEGMTYEVRVTWSDPDGVNGTNPIVGTVTTFPTAPPTGGDVITVGPGGSIPQALALAGPGDTIRVSGTHPPFTLDKSGGPNAYLKLEGFGASIAGGSGDNITVTGDYLWIDGFTFLATAENSITVESSTSFLYVTNTTHENFAATATSGLYAAVQVRAGASNLFILNNYFNTNNSYHNTFGVYFQRVAGHTFVIADNVFAGAIRDGVGGESNSSWNSGPRENADFARNDVTSFQRNDDGVEFEGSNVNVRIWGNTIRNGSTEIYPAPKGIALAPSVVGPAYVFRNFVEMHVGNGNGVKLANGASAYAFFFHNTFYTESNNVSESGGGETSDLFTYRNNIFYTTSGRTISGGGRLNDYDYDLHYKQNGGAFFQFDGSTFSSLTSLYNSTGAEQHGVQGNPQFLGGGPEILQSSPAHDAGVVIANFNDANSAWPFRGGAPDIGAFEYGDSVPQLDTTPPTVSIIEPAP